MPNKKRKGVISTLSSVTITVIFVLIVLAVIVFLFTDTDFPFKLSLSDDFSQIFSYLGIENDFSSTDPASDDLENSINMDIYVIDVGQGSSTLIISGDRSILVDGGENGNGKKIVQKLNQLGFYHLDMMIGTHPHSDHIGGLDEVMEEIEVHNIILPELPKSLIPTTKTYIDLLKKIESQQKTITPSVPGDNYEIGNLHLEILGPILGADSNLNNFSVITKVTGGSTSVLITGDAEKSAEELLLSRKSKLNSDILIVGHHGSDTSSSEKFLEAVSPSYGAISVGYNNSYGHPSQEIINRLNSMNCNIYRTDQHGNIVFRVKNNNISVESDN